MENIISTLIVEDEEIWIRSLQLILNDFGFSISKVVSTTEDALNAFATADYDVILMDIHLNGKNSGIELGKIVNKLYHKPFIFITASQQHNIREAAEANPSAYLPKPINPSSLYVAIQSAIYNFSNNQTPTVNKNNSEDFSSFFVKQGNRLKKLDWKDIAFVTAGKNYVSVFNSIDKVEYYIRSSLQKTLTQIIPEHLQKQFIQINRADAVQLSFIKEVVNTDVRTPFKTFQLTDGFSKDLKHRLNIVA